MTKECKLESSWLLHSYSSIIVVTEHATHVNVFVLLFFLFFLRFFSAFAVPPAGALVAGPAAAAAFNAASYGISKPDAREAAARFLKARATQCGAAALVMYPDPRERAVMFCDLALNFSRMLSGVIERTLASKSLSPSRNFLMCILYSNGLIFSLSRRAA